MRFVIFTGLPSGVSVVEARRPDNMRTHTSKGLRFIWILTDPSLHARSGKASASFTRWKKKGNGMNRVFDCAGKGLVVGVDRRVDMG